MEGVSRNEKESRFEIALGEHLAVAEYVARPGEIVVTHVVVPPSLRGQGIATRLAEAVIESARQDGVKVRPLCSFMAAHFQRHPEHSDLLA